MITGSNVKAPIAARHRVPQQVALGKIARQSRVFGPLQPAEVAPAPHQSKDFVAAPTEFVSQIGPDKAGGAGDEALHGRPLDQKTLEMSKKEKKRFDMRLCLMD
jgi:hypothetical protein